MSGSSKSVQMTKYFTSINYLYILHYFLHEINILKFKYLCWENNWNPNPALKLRILESWYFMKNQRIPDSDCHPCSTNMHIFIIELDNLLPCLHNILFILQLHTKVIILYSGKYKSRHFRVNIRKHIQWRYFNFCVFYNQLI